MKKELMITKHTENGEKEGIELHGANGKIYKGLDDSTNIVFIKAIWKLNDIYKKYLQCE